LVEIECDRLMVLGRFRILCDGCSADRRASVSSVRAAPVAVRDCRLATAAGVAVVVL